MSSPLPIPSGPSETAVRTDIAHLRMRVADDDGRFGIVDHRHPRLLAWVNVNGRPLGLCLDVAGYPGNPPAGQPWDLSQDRPLESARWPLGGRPVFRLDWSVANGNAPYLAVDRVALTTHANWAAEMPSRAWNASKTIHDYLASAHEALSLSRLPGES